MKPDGGNSSQQPKTTKSRIYQAALELFCQKGYDATSIREICKAVGIREASFYNHYPSKADLLEQVFLQSIELQASPISQHDFEHATQAIPLAQLLRKLLSRYVETMRNENGLRTWQVVSMEQYKNPRAAQLIMDESKRRVDQLAAAFASLQKQSLMRPCDPLAAARLYGNALRAQYLNWSLRSLHGTNANDAIREMREMTDAFCESFQSTPIVAAATRKKSTGKDPQ